MPPSIFTYGPSATVVAQTPTNAKALKLSEISLGHPFCHPKLGSDIIKVALGFRSATVSDN